MFVPPYVHSSVDFGYSLIVQRKLVDLHSVADEFTHDFDLELVQLTLADGVSFGDDWDDVHLWQHINTFLPQLLLFRIHRQDMKHMWIIQHLGKSIC